MPVPQLKTLYPGPAPVIHQLGPYSALAFPNYWRRRLRGMHLNYVVIDFNLTPGGSNKYSVNLPPGTWIVSARAVTSRPAGIRFQIFDPINDEPLSQRPFDLRNGAGTGTLPLVLQRPLSVHETTPVLIRVRNQDLANSQTGQLALQTYFRVE